MEFEWKGYRWRTGQPWGDTHPKRTNCWFDPEAVGINSEGALELRVIRNPRDFDGVVKNYGIGLVSSLDHMSYGKYTWRVKLPHGANLWPSLWTCAYNSWPPEIDMLEAYTYPRDCDYIKNWFSSYLETNVHYSKLGVHRQVKAKAISTLIYKLFHKEIDEYSFVWTPTYVKFYFNGHLVRTVKNKDVINDLNLHNDIYPIMNLQINEEYTDWNCKQNPVFTIYDFSYEKLKS